MARKYTAAQQTTLARINAGWPETFIRAGEPPAVASALHHVHTHHDCSEPDGTIRCHRTIRTDTPAGSQVQSFRIHRDGSVVRHL